MISREWFVFTRERFVITTGGVCLQHNVGDYNKLFVIATEERRVISRERFVITRERFLVTTEGV